MPRYNSNVVINGSVPVTRPNKSSKTKKTLPTVQCKSKNNVLFSYKYFKCASLKNNEFNNCFKNILDYAQWITFCLERISYISTMSIGELYNSGSVVRFHHVKDESLAKLKEVLKELNLNVDDIFSQDESQSYYELSLGAGNWRIFGYLIENMYFILLLDPNHLIYPNVSKGAKQDLLYKNYKPWEQLLSNNNEVHR